VQLNDINFYKECLRLFCMDDLVGIQFSWKISVLFILIIILMLVFLNLFNADEKTLKTFGDILFGIGIGLFVGTFFAFSAREQKIMFFIYAITGLISLIVGSVLKNFS